MTPRTALATIRLKATEEGGKTLTIGQGYDYRCPVFFKDIQALSEHGWESRLLLKRVGKSIKPGETAEGIPIAFLSPDKVFPHLHIGVRFELWESGIIGEGEITAICE